MVQRGVKLTPRLFSYNGKDYYLCKKQALQIARETGKMVRWLQLPRTIKTYERLDDGYRKVRTGEVIRTKTVLITAFEVV